MRSGVTSCVGDTVNFTCTLVGVVHSWRIPGFSANVLANALTDNLGPYEIQVISVNGTMVTGSRLSVNSSRELDGVDITCEAFGGGGEPQETTVMVFGKISWREVLF